MQQYAAELVRETGMRPHIIITSPRILAAYERSLEQTAAIELLLQTATGLHRYFLRRSLGERRLRILAPRLDRLAQRARWRRVEWKHRHDPEWQ
jgi:hypothetical protein